MTGEEIAVAAIVAGAAVFLIVRMVRTFAPKKDADCGCGEADKCHDHGKRKPE